MDDLLSIICSFSTTSKMAFELTNTIHTAWRTTEERPLEYMSCKAVCLYYEEKYSWLDALSLAYDIQLKGITMLPECKEVAFEIHSVCLAVNDIRRYRVMEIAVED